MLNLYEILGVEKSATITAIRNAFRRKAKQHHPDVGGQIKEWQKLLIAHNVLINDKRRERYDQTGEHEEESTKNHMEQVALAILSRLIQSMIGQDANLTEMNLKKHGLLALKGEIKNLEQQLDSIRSAYERAKMISGRWTVGDPDEANVMGDLLRGQFDELDRARQNILGHIEAHKLAISILNKHDFRYDIKEVPVHYNTIFYTTAGQ